MINTAIELAENGHTPSQEAVEKSGCWMAVGWIRVSETRKELGKHLNLKRPEHEHDPGTAGLRGTCLLGPERT